MIKNIKELIKTTKLYDIYSFIRFNTNYRKIKYLYKNNLWIKNITCSKKLDINILDTSLLDSGFILAFLIPILLLKRLSYEGANVIVLLQNRDIVSRLYSLFNFKIIYFDDYLVKEINPELHFNIVKNLIELEYKDVKIGKLALSTWMRLNRRGNFDINNLEHVEEIKKLLKMSAARTEASNKIIDKIEFDKLICLEKGYVNYGEIVEASLNREKDVIQWCGCHRDSSFTLKRYNKNNFDMHPASISEETWDTIKNHSLTKQQEKELYQELYENYSTGKWYSEVGTQCNKVIEAEKDVIKKLGLNSERKTAFIFSHLFWDATFFWGEDLFQDYEDWFIQTVKAACKNTMINWVIKLHPANITKMQRDGVNEEYSEIIALKKNSLLPLPNHIKIMMPETRINTYSLFKIMDYCITVRGTIGIESAIFGIPVITAGTGRYDRKGFTIDSNFCEGYLNNIKNIQKIEKLSEDQKELALKYAYLTFIGRRFDLESLTIAYRNDQKITQDIKINLKTFDMFKKAKDLKEFADWVLFTKKEDYLKPGFI